MTRMIYLDNAATTQPLKKLCGLFENVQQTGWLNPSAAYPGAVECRSRVEEARAFLCATVGAENCLFTSSGTECANTALFQGFKKEGGKKRHFVCSLYEHPAVHECLLALQAAGHAVTWIAPDKKSGVITAEAVAAAVTEETALVAVMHVNNETGAVNDLPLLSRTVKAKNPAALFYADGVQGYLKTPFLMGEVDYYAVSAHKLHALKGTGALFYKKGAPLSALMLGGGQESLLRSGTENTFGIFAFRVAAEEYLKDQAAKLAHMAMLKERLLALLAPEEPFVVSPPNGAPHILNVAFPGMRGEVLLRALAAEGVYISTGSACASSSKRRTSRVHTALSLPKEVSESAVRISFCPDNTLFEIEETARLTKAALKKYRRPLRR